MDLIKAFLMYSGATVWLFILAMLGMMSLPPDRLLSWSGMGSNKEHDTIGEWMASNCLQIADALIAELNKDKKHGK